jgi:hypothetical protein
VAVLPNGGRISISVPNKRETGLEPATSSLEG